MAKEQNKPAREWEYDFGKPAPKGPLSKEAMDQLERTCGKVPKSKGGSGPG